jgi:hypothetical protein
MLLEVDGLDVQWRNGVASDWEGELGDNESDGFSAMAPFAIRRLQCPEIASFGSRAHEQACQVPRPLFQSEIHNMNRQRDNNNLPSRNAAGEDDMSEGSDGVHDEVVALPHSDGSIVINTLSCTDFRRQLVVHFDILFRQNWIVWATHKTTN